MATTDLETMPIADHLDQGFRCFPVEYLSGGFDPNRSVLPDIASECFRTPGRRAFVVTVAYNDGW